MVTIAGGILLAVVVVLVCSSLLAVFIVPTQLFFEYLSFSKHKKLPIRHVELSEDFREGSGF